MKLLIKLNYASDLNRLPNTMNSRSHIHTNSPVLV